MEKTVAKVFNALHRSHDVRRATAYLSEKSTVKITRQRRDKRSSHHTYLLTIGAPNYREREFIKACKKAGERFPVKKIQLQHYQAKR